MNNRRKIFRASSVPVTLGVLIICGSVLHAKPSPSQTSPGDQTNVVQTSSPADAVTCGIPGDVTDDGSLDAGDFSQLIDYLVFLETTLPANPLNADCDGVRTITYRDLLYLFDFIFSCSPTPLLTCPATAQAPTVPDSSVQISYPTSVPPGVSSMAVPLYLSIDKDVRGIMLPVKIKVDSELAVIGDAVPGWMEVFLLFDSSSGATLIRQLKPFCEDTPLPANYAEPICTVYVSFSTSPLARTLSIEWCPISPAPLLSDTTSALIYPQIIAAEYNSTATLANGATEQSPGYLPEFYPLLVGIECCQGTRGNMDGDAGDNIDITDLTYLVAYMFGGGPASPCWLETDVNGDTSLDISDLTYLVAYMFGGGPEPVACP